MKKYYAVKEGKIKGLFMDWNEVQPLVRGVKGAQYKGFNDPNKALNYLLGKESNKKTKKHNPTKETELEAFVDGSYNHSKESFSSGVVILENGNMIEQLAIADDNDELCKFKNVSGELIAAMKAMEFAVENNKSITIYYDYAGIEKLTNEWKAKSDITKLYKKYYNSIKGIVPIKFKKVKAHSGIEFNELADKLAAYAFIK